MHRPIRWHSQLTSRAWQSSRAALLVATAIASLACDDEKNGILPIVGTAQPVLARRVVGIAEVTFREIGTPEMTSDMIIAPTVSELTALRAARAANPASVSTKVPLQTTLIAVGSFTLTPTSGSRLRFIRATYGVRNTRADSVVFDRVRENLTFVAAASAGSIGETAVTSILRRDGLAATPSLAQALTATSLLAEDGSGGLIDLAPNVLRALAASELATIRLPTAITGVFPFGFAIRNAPTTSPDFEGDVTFAFSLPQQATASDDASTISVLFLIVDDALVPVAAGS